MMDIVNNYQPYITYVGILLITILVDWLNVLYVKNITKKQPWQAATTAASIHLINALLILKFIDDPWAILAMIAGTFIGTYIGTAKK